MNRRLLLFALMSLALSILVAPARAVGPQKAEKNPNLMVMPEGAELLLPSGGFHSWTADTEFWYVDYEHGVDARKARGLSRKATAVTLADILDVMTDPAAALGAENKWFYLSYAVLVDMMVDLEGLSQEEAEAMAAMWPEGIYVRFVNVGT